MLKEYIQSSRDYVANRAWFGCRWRINFARSVTNTHDSPRDTYRRDESPNVSVSLYVVDEIENPHASIVRTREENYFGWGI